MKASVRWLRELCPQLPDDAAAIAARFTSAGIDVEGSHAFGLGAEACFIASVVSSRPHPSRSGLRLVTVDRGGAQQELVCGAPNVPEPGGLVVLAPLGAHLPAKNATIERRTIAGVPSEGMLCSEAELGLGTDSDGILVLPAGTAPPGTPMVQALPAARDTILEIGLTPNRPDALGHLGLAREAAALFGVPLSPSGGDGEAIAEPVRTRQESLGEYVAVTIEDGERCPYYGASVLVDVTVGPSPLDLRWRLASLGVRPISNVVDVTNLVMLELGHPTHAFDLDKVRGRAIVVRRARSGEKLRTLDGVERTLVEDDLVICDGEGPVALAGVMGGGESEITSATRRVLLECAYFDPRGVRRAARRHALHTESSHRFERGVDWGDTRAALARGAQLIAKLAKGTAVQPVVVIEAQPLARRTIALRQDRLSALLGIEIEREEVRGVLDRLGFARRAAQAESASAATPDQPSSQDDRWEVPSFRPDVTREVDLIEEVGRVHGYDAIPAVLPPVRPTRDAAPREALARRARRAAVGMGLSEAITYAFVSRADLAAVGAPPAAVVLRNPMNEEQPVMRTSLLPGLLRTLANARRRGEGTARMFSVGPVFLSGDPSSEGPLPEERLSFVALLSGNRPGWLTRSQGVDVWDAKGIAEGLAQRMLRRPAVLRPASGGERPGALHPRGAAWVEVAGKRVGSLGPLHPDVGEAFEVGDGAVVVVEIDLAGLEAVGVQPARFTSLPRFPASTRDLAVVVREDVPAGDVEDAAREAAGELAEEVSLFDRFVGGSVPAGHASLALHVVYRAPDRTLTDADVDARHAQLVAAVEKRFGASLRGPS